MINSQRLKSAIEASGLSQEQIAGHIVRTGLKQKDAQAALKNWQRGLIKPIPQSEDIEKLATVLNMQASQLSQWDSSIRYAPMAPRKVQLVAALIAGRDVQKAMDILKFTRKRASYFIEKTLKSAIACADEAAADVENLYVKQARVNGAGIRVGTKRYRAKDRGRAHRIQKLASHIYISVAEKINKRGD